MIRSKIVWNLLTWAVVFGCFVSTAAADKTCDYTVENVQVLPSYNKVIVTVKNASGTREKVLGWFSTNVRDNMETATSQRLAVAALLSGKRLRLIYANGISCNSRDHGTAPKRIILRR